MPVDPAEAKQLTVAELNESIELLWMKRRNFIRLALDVESDIVTLKEELRRRSPEKCFP